MRSTYIIYKIYTGGEIEETVLCKHFVVGGIDKPALLMGVYFVGNGKLL